MTTIRLFGNDIKVEEKEKEITSFGKRIFPHAALNKNKKQHNRFTNRTYVPPSYLPPRNICLAIRLVGGSKPVYIGRKIAQNSDVSVNLSRLLITATYCTKLLDDLIALEIENQANKDAAGVKVSVMDPQGNFHGMNLKRWKSLGRLVFNRGWNDLVSVNKLQKGDTVDLWNFKTPLGQPCFAINIIKN